MRLLRPNTKLGRTTVWLGGLSILLIALRWITGSKNLGSWAALVTIVFAFCGVWLISRWALRHLMWRLRNRLIVTYIFIGVIPIVLLLMMAGVGSYLFAGQFATYIVISNLHSALQRLEAVNTTSNPTTLVVPDYEQYRRLESQVRAAERSTLLRMRDQNQVTDEVMRKVERELDLLDARQLSNRF